jgi:3-hydroxyisobutyrate dehydrogenase-like beta-hydroxyacid dehydrogenase
LILLPLDLGIRCYYAEKMGEPMMAIAIVSMGEMGSGIAGLLVGNGAQVLTSLEGRSVASASRAEAAGVEVVDDLAMIEQAEILLSVVPPLAARATAVRFLPLIERSQSKPAFLECNAIAPQTVLDLSKPFTENGLRFVDAGIIGLSPKKGGKSPRLYMSGPVQGEAEMLRSFGLDARVLSDALGDASALKMAYAGINKGFQAIGTAMVLAAARNGAADSLVAELQESQPEFYAWLAKKIPAMYSKAYRWDDEMREIAKFLEPEAGSVGMLNGAADLFHHIAAEYRHGTGSEVISALDKFAESPKARA